MTPVVAAGGFAVDNDNNFANVKTLFVVLL
jgi:hypothetical protein